MDCCCCNVSYEEPDSAPCPVTLDVPAIISELDELLNSDRLAEAGEHLAKWRRKAQEVGDWRAELSVISEQLGYVRRNGDRELALECADSAQRLIREHRMGDTVSGATVLLNAATTMKGFGLAEKSLPLFNRVARVYGENLDPADYRMAGLYNNMALSYMELGMTEQAEKYFLLALKIIAGTERPGNDTAVTYCNMAELYAMQDAEDGRIETCADKAFEALTDESLPRDGYNAFTISKCLPCFDKFGFFLYAKTLRERMESIRKGY